MLNNDDRGVLLKARLTWRGKIKSSEPQSKTILQSILLNGLTMSRLPPILGTFYWGSIVQNATHPTNGHTVYTTPNQSSRSHPKRSILFVNGH